MGLHARGLCCRPAGAWRTLAAAYSGRQITFAVSPLCHDASVEPVPRQEVYDTYWRFAAERQAVFERRATGQSAPWTSDEILLEYKFCNTFRASDRISQYLIANIVYGEGSADLPPEDLFLRIILFRLFSKEPTWEAIDQVSRGLTRTTLDVSRLGDALADLKSRQSIYTAAFILCAADPYGHSAKHRNHLELVRQMFLPGALGLSLARARSLQAVYGALIEWPMIGPFLAYQLAIDLNYSAHFSFSEDEFTVPGPGAVRGLKKVFRDFGSYSPSELILYMKDRQQDEFARLGLTFNGLFGRPLHAIDCQGLFCETDKYSRAAFPELKSNRQRIKQSFKPTGRPLPLFYPPKWGLSVPSTTVLSTPALAEQLTLSLAAEGPSEYHHPRLPIGLAAS